MLLLAGDLVDPGPAIETLLSAAREAEPTTASLLAVDAEARTQLLLGLHRTRELARALRLLERVENASVRDLLRPLATVLVPVPTGSTDDIDDPADARAHGIAIPGRIDPGAGPTPGAGSTRSAESTHD
ncbi:hypothetical protein Q0F99_13605 [Rathayibacter oskolensis]|uniref:hypothetical protein n=1 Tax=Rathayibacter oskolensis TaxID=1891671 RepID=UPI00266001A8|nr:hypothetical protein [Rathayibacter oskolensis]WKK70796.1 hypothetical protein Q0F99_13605 [Rathayibacter oskolensis]